MYLKDVAKKSEAVTIADRYDVSIGNIMELVHEYPDSVDLACACFRLGYLQGTKAERARGKRRTK